MKSKPPDNEHPDYLLKAVENLYTQMQNPNSSKGMTMPQIDKDIQKEAVKEALKEWLDEQFIAFGKWSAFGIVAIFFAGLAYIWFKSQGWTK
jgi:uncharacterized membrane protein YraQ (UPF0718 family)